MHRRAARAREEDGDDGAGAEDVWRGAKWEAAWGAWIWGSGSATTRSELCGTLPALDKLSCGKIQILSSPHILPPINTWDSPDEVKAMLKYWAQAVACIGRLYS
uniref:Uncharacterized protein n=1 Tax=Oryza brachyantha TaxID=4533 RepID=J3LLZ1_ORYBR